MKFRFWIYISNFLLIFIVNVNIIIDFNLDLENNIEIQLNKGLIHYILSLI